RPCPHWGATPVSARERLPRTGQIPPSASRSSRPTSPTAPSSPSPRAPWWSPTSSRTTSTSTATPNTSPRPSTPSPRRSHPAARSWCAPTTRAPAPSGSAPPRGVRPSCATAAAWAPRQERSGPRGAEIEIDTPHGELTVQLSVTGHHNVLNALGALAASSVAVPEADLAGLAAGLGTFSGASRRFDVAGTVGGVTVVDDYAHHPREVAATIAAARGIVAGQSAPGRVLVAFQPHLFSRTRDLAVDFAAALSAADLAWVLPVYAAREDPDPTVDARTITELAAESVEPVAGPEELLDRAVATARPGDLLLM